MTFTMSSKSDQVKATYLLPTKVVAGKVMFSQASVCPWGCEVGNITCIMG